MHALQRQNADPPKVRAAPGDGGGRCLWAKSVPMLTSGRNTLVVSGKGGFFQELGHCPLFGLLQPSGNYHGIRGSDFEYYKGSIMS